MSTATLDKVHKTTSREVGKTTKPLVVKYTTHLPPDLVKWLKREAVERDMKDYQLVTQAVLELRSKAGAA